MSVPTLYVRNVPRDVYDELQRHASRSGRSLNALVLDVLREFVERERQSGRFMERLDELRREFLLPDDAPKPEDVIREERDARAREIERRAGL